MTDTDTRPEIHAKHFTIIITAGTEDRDRTFEEMQNDLAAAINGVPGVKRVIPSGYYILDGKVCLPDDYDPETQNFKPGSHPPAWAGGPVRREEKPKGDPIGRSPAEPRKKQTPIEKAIDDATQAVEAAKNEEEASE